MTDFYDEGLASEFASSAKQSLEDVGLDNEERDKIKLQISASRGPKKLRVDWSDFAEHTVFGSAYHSITFALSRIFDDENGYPFDGELKEKNAWRLDNTDFENWWFDNEYPHQFGHSYFPSGSGENVFIVAEDYENKIELGSTSSFTIEFVIDPYTDFNGRMPVFGNINSDDIGVLSYLHNDGASKTIVCTRRSGSTEESFSASYDAYISSSHRVSFRYDFEAQTGHVYIDGVLAAANNNQSLQYDNFVQSIKIGSFTSASVDYYYSGAIDDFRIYTSARNPALIERNWFGDTHANHSASMCLYYKFNELEELNPSTTVIDYSGKGVHGTFTGSFTASLSRVSGTLGSWYKTYGDPIFNRSNTRVSASLAKWFASGSIHDQTNQSFIYNLVPSFFIDEEDSDLTKLFILLMGRHYDRLRLYAKHLGFMLFSNESDYNNAPDELLDVLAKNYGMDLGGVYEANDPLEYFFGESIFTGSIKSPLQQIRNQVRRNLVNNLTYIIKTKSTKEAIEASLRALAVDPAVININEYSIFSGGIETSYTQKTVEKRVLRLHTGSNLALHSSSFDTGPTTWETRFLFNTASVNTTSSIFTVFSGSDRVIQVRSERENPTSSLGRIVFEYPGATDSPLTSSLVKLYDNEWVNIMAYKPDSGGTFGFNLGRLFRDEIDFHVSASGDATGGVNDTPVEYASIFSASWGTSGSAQFDGFIQEVRVWHEFLSRSAIAERHFKDFDSTTPEDFLRDARKLKIHHKLFDYTGSATTTVPAHNWAFSGAPNGAITGVSESADYNFPGKFISKLEPSYSYDIGINNDKIRLRSGSANLSEDQIVKDIPYLSVDISPISSLNKEIVKWFGDLEKFNNIIGQPYNQYKTEVEALNQYRFEFFDKLENKISFKSYLNLLKWFDSNFSFFLSQLVPLDMASSISSFVVESHMLEHNKVERPFPFRDRGGSSKNLEASINIIQPITGGFGGIFDLADPGRFGAAVSASADFHESRISYPESSSNGVTYNDTIVRKLNDKILQDNSGSQWGRRKYANGFYSKSITGSRTLENQLGVIEGFDSTKVPYLGAAAGTFDGSLLSSSQGPATNSHFSASSSLNFIQDQRWLWGEHEQSVQTPGSTQIDAGIRYGGGIGQLFYLFGKSLRVGSTQNDGNNDVFGPQLGHSTSVRLASVENPVERFEVGENSITYIVWPDINAFEGVKIQKDPGAGIRVGKILDQNTQTFRSASFLGPSIDVEGYRYLDLSILNKINGTIDIWDIQATIKFQFSENEFDGEGQYESIASSSYAAGTSESSIDPTLTQNKMSIAYYFDKSRQDDLTGIGGSPRSFTFRLPRNIPNAKKMRVFIDYKMGDDEPDAFMVSRVLVKATLYKDERPNTFTDITKIDF